MRVRLLALMLLLTFPVGPAVAQSEDDVNSRIDMVLGDHAPYRAAFDKLQHATLMLDASAFAELVSYPITVKVEGEELTIQDEEAFAEAFSRILTLNVATAIHQQAWEDLFVSDQGVMFGDGQVWLNGICVDETCSNFDVRVVAIQTMPD